MSEPRELLEYRRLGLCGGLLLLRVVEMDAEIIDAIGRPATAKTVIIGRTLEITLSAALDAREISVSL